MMAYISTSLLLGAFGLAIYYIHAWLDHNAAARRHDCQQPPRRYTLDPILGLGYIIQDAKSANQGKTLPDGEALHNEYGPTYRESSIFGTTIKTANEENARAIFGTKAKEWGVKPFRYEGMRPFCGAGVLSTDGSLWEHSRTMLKPFFLKSNISDLTTFERSVEQLLERLPRDGSTVDLEPLFSVLFANTASRFVLGVSLGLWGQEKPNGSPVSGEVFLKAFQLSLMGCGLRMFLGPFRALIPRSMTTKQWQVVHKFFDFYVDNALLDTTDEKQDPVRDRHSVINTLVRQTDDRLKIRNQAIHAMIAAQDTLPMLLSNTLFCLSRSPAIWDRLRDEVASVGSDALTIEEARKFKLLRNILSESLRLFPVFPVLARDALVDTILPTGGGPQGDKPIFAPAGTRVVGDFYTLHRNASIFGPDTHKFDPDRWNTIQPGPWQDMTFGGGMRACLGRHKALGEASCVLIRLVQNFKMIETKDSRDWAGVLQLVARNTNGCKVALIPA